MLLRPAGLALGVILAALSLPVVAAPRAAAMELNNSFLYQPPERPPKGERNHYVDAPADWLLDQIADHLRISGLTVEWQDDSRRTLVGRYAGDPREYVDCGIVQMLADGRRLRPPRQYSANRPETRTHRTSRGKRVGLLRELHLDARMTVEVEPDGKGARVKSEALYVLTRTVSRIFRGGDPGPVLAREVMSFRSDEIGRFKKGTTCVANGRLEDLPALPFRKSSS